MSCHDWGDESLNEERELMAMHIRAGPWAGPEKRRGFLNAGIRIGILVCLTYMTFPRRNNQFWLMIFASANAICWWLIAGILNGYAYWALPNYECLIS